MVGGRREMATDISRGKKTIAKRHKSLCSSVFAIQGERNEHEFVEWARIQPARLQQNPDEQKINEHESTESHE